MGCSFVIFSEHVCLRRVSPSFGKNDTIVVLFSQGLFSLVLNFSGLRYAKF